MYAYKYICAYVCACVFTYICIYNLYFATDKDADKISNLTSNG